MEVTEKKNVGAVLYDEDGEVIATGAEAFMRRTAVPRGTTLADLNASRARAVAEADKAPAAGRTAKEDDPNYEPGSTPREKTKGGKSK
jgi:hypothetical protein